MHPVFMPKIGEAIKFVIGRHVTIGVVRDIRGGGFASNENSILLVEVAPEIFEVVYLDEVVR